MRAVGFHSEPPKISSASRDTHLHQQLINSSDRLDSRSEIEIYAHRNSHNIIKWYEPSQDETANNFSARNDRYRKMIASFSGPDAQLALVLVPDASHLAEDLETFVTRLLELDRLGTEVRCTDPDLPDPLQSGVNLLGLGGESPQRQTRIRSAVLSKASRGEVLGRTPYGYAAGPDGLLKVMNQEAEIVKEIFKTYAGPRYSEDAEPVGGPGLRAIARSLNNRGIGTRTGRPWSALAISGILKNRTYLGTYARYGVRIAGSHEPLVDRETFNRADAVTKSRTPVRNEASQQPYIFGGIARCSLCGRGLNGLTRRRVWKRTDGSSMSKSYRYYECPSRDASRERIDGSLRHSTWREKELDDAVRENVARWGIRIKKKLRPFAKDKAAHELTEAERYFNRSVRLVASAYGTLADLESPLDQLSKARKAVDLADETSSGVGDILEIDRLVNDLLSSDIDPARLAARALIERVIASEEQFEVIPRT